MNEQTIYIIDDEQQTVDLLAEYARLLGCKVCVYTEAVKFFEEADSCDDNAILVLDLIMPGMDGVEVMRQMVETGKIVPLILMSGYDSGVLHSAEQLAKAYSLDIIATINKPVEFKLFKNILEKYSKIERQSYSRSEFKIEVSDLETALKDDQLVLHYQPQIDVKSGSLAGVEALVRWQHPQHGLIYPDSFISMAEDNGLIGDLTSQVIKQAMEQSLYWKSRKLVLQVSVNVSADNITSLSLPELLSSMLDTHQLDPTMLTLEVTESALMGELITSLDILTRLRMKGIELSIDDFGTGYSSLSQLYRMPFTELKVDQSFVMNMQHDHEARGIVKTCITLGHELNMHVVAEGVEDKETFLLLKEMGCDIAQGYYFAKPMPAENLISWNDSRNQAESENT
ncbi:MAG: hypothetical protein DIZ80_01895 [endosymbiont of Galathealinum brachiosum]|uniref:cyclic-guanylate-specific phosphodiesterase n=1 Tax=endosymbiont of Galathealinum brachiosum TaxID=2200906 RepID=A0A370DLB8_9GAMM|nr:MAG: hypothetical protein DIZ80_01895 [endosymbiont of Galathealinum brachiosum]